MKIYICVNLAKKNFHKKYLTIRFPWFRRWMCDSFPLHQFMHFRKFWKLQSIITRPPPNQFYEKCMHLRHIWIRSVRNPDAIKMLDKRKSGWSESEMITMEMLLLFPSVFCLLPSSCQLLTSVFLIITSRLLLLISYFFLLSSYFWFVTSHFVLLTSYLPHLISYVLFFLLISEC